MLKIWSKEREISSPSKKKFRPSKKALQVASGPEGVTRSVMINLRTYFFYSPFYFSFTWNPHREILCGDFNAGNLNDNVNERPIEPFKYDLVEHLKHIHARLHILDLLQISKETQDIFIRELEELDHNNQVHVAQVHQIEKKHQVAKSKRP